MQKVFCVFLIALLTARSSPRTKDMALDRHKTIEERERKKGIIAAREEKFQTENLEFDCMRRLAPLICWCSSSTEKRSSMLSALVSLGESRSFIHIFVLSRYFVYFDIIQHRCLVHAIDYKY